MHVLASESPGVLPSHGDTRFPVKNAIIAGSAAPHPAQNLLAQILDQKAFLLAEGIIDSFVRRHYRQFLSSHLHLLRCPSTWGTAAGYRLQRSSEHGSFSIRNAFGFAVPWGRFSVFSVTLITYKIISAYRGAGGAAGSPADRWLRRIRRGRCTLLPSALETHPPLWGGRSIFLLATSFSTSLVKNGKWRRDPYTLLLMYPMLRHEFIPMPPFIADQVHKPFVSKPRVIHHNNLRKFVLGADFAE